MLFSRGVRDMSFSKATGYFGKAHGDTVDFSLGEPRDRPPETAIKAYIEALRRGSNRYSPVQGLPELREGIAAKLRESNGIDASPGEVFVTGGASEGISFSIMSFLNGGEEAIITEPSYPIISQMVRFCGGVPKSLLLTEDKGFGPDLEELKEMVSRRTRLLVLNTPHNPTGTVIGARTLKAISEIFDGVILVDEVYENFTYGRGHVSLASISDRPEKVITVNSFSKTYCMCGYRVGYLHASDEIIRQMLKLKLCVSTCTSTPAQAAALAALGDQGFPKGIKTRFSKRRELMVRWLRELDLRFVEPEGAFYVFPDISEIGNDETAFRLFLDAGVLTMPGSIFHHSCRKNVRMSFVVSEDEIMKGIERLEGVLS